MLVYGWKFPDPAHALGIQEQFLFHISFQMALQFQADKERDERCSLSKDKSEDKSR